jgi:hypothetical protein
MESAQRVPLERGMKVRIAERSQEKTGEQNKDQNGPMLLKEIKQPGRAEAESEKGGPQPGRPAAQAAGPDAGRQTAAEEQERSGHG